MILSSLAKNLFLNALALAFRTLYSTMSLPQKTYAAAVPTKTHTHAHL